MELLTTQPLWMQLIFLGLTLGILMVLGKLFLLPYQNKLMIWYMKCFDRDYKKAKATFDKLVQDEQCCYGNHAKFLARVQNDFRFQGLEHMEKNHGPAKKEEGYRAWEVLTATWKNSADVHQIEVWFSFYRDRSPRLMRISFFYQNEKRKNDDPYVIQKKEYSSGSDDSDEEQDPEPAPVLELEYA